MAITLKSNYQKRLGLPGYSSHSFSAEIETEINSADDIPMEIARLYHLLQFNVDQQIVTPGFVPSETYGMEAVNQLPPSAPTPPPAHPTPAATTAMPTQAQEPTPTSNVIPMTNLTGWHCSEKQRDLILKLIDENNLDKMQIENLATQRFGKGVKQLNKLEASSLIGLIFESMLKQPAQGQRKQYRKGGQR